MVQMGEVGLKAGREFKAHSEDESGWAGNRCNDATDPTEL